MEFFDVQTHPYGRHVIFALHMEVTFLPLPARADHDNDDLELFVSSSLDTVWSKECKPRFKRFCVTCFGMNQLEASRPVWKLCLECQP